MQFPLTDKEVLALDIDLDLEAQIDSDTYDRLYSYYVDSNEMPYGVAKARSGDPDQWIADQIAQRAQQIRSKHVIHG
jgi:hypothetical protein